MRASGLFAWIGFSLRSVGRLLTKLSICSAAVWTVGSAGAESGIMEDTVQELDAEQWFDELQQEMAVELLNEVSSRRRLNQLFENPQLGLNGLARFGYASAVDGSVTFLVRDHVVVSNTPILFGRIYDSRQRTNSDLGPGWKLSLTETLSLRKRKAVLIDANGNRLELQRTGDRLSTSEVESFRGRVTDTGARITIGGATRVFSNCDDELVLTSYRLDDQERIRLAYDDHCRLRRAVMPDGRGVRLRRNPEGLVSRVMGVGGESVDLTYEYGAGGQIEVVRDGRAETVERYTYDDSGYIRTVIDAKENTVAHFRFSNNGKAREARVLSQTYTFERQPGLVIVRNGGEQISRITFDRNQRQISAQDNTGLTTVLALGSNPWDETLSAGDDVRIQSNRRNDSTVSITEVLDGATSNTTIEYGSHGLTSITRDGESTLRVTYGIDGAVESVVTTEFFRSYDRLDGGKLGIGDGEDSLEIATDNLGRLVTANRSDGKSLGFSYTNRSVPDSVSFTSEGEAPVYADYTYDGAELRSSSNYDGTWSVEYRYANSGALTGIDFATEEGSLRGDTYHLNESYQLDSIESTGGDIGLDLSYDGRGRVKSIDFQDRSLKVEYDALSRVDTVYLDDAELVQKDYRYGELDVVTASDKKTLRIVVDAVPGSGVFGTLDELVYSRPIYSASKLVLFDQETGQFMLRDHLDRAPDHVLWSSLRTRNLVENNRLIGETPYGPWIFDKPSNSLFIPPTLRSVNCYVCLGGITAHTFTADGNPPFAAPVPEGMPAAMETIASVEQCTNGFDTFPYIPPFITVTQTYSGEGSDTETYAAFFGSTVVNMSEAVTFDSRGSRAVSSFISCSCNIFSTSNVAGTVDVVCSEESRRKYHAPRFIKHSTLGSNIIAPNGSPGPMIVTVEVQGTEDEVDLFRDGVNTYWAGVYDIQTTNPKGLYGIVFVVTRWDPIQGAINNTQPDFELIGVLNPGQSCGHPLGDGAGCAQQLVGKKIWYKLTLSDADKEIVMAHEFGHLMGFDDAYIVGTPPQDVECHENDIMTWLNGMNTRAGSYHAAILRDQY